MNKKVRNLVHCAIGAGIISVAAQIAITLPISLVPMTLLTLAVYIISLIYTPKNAVITCLTYILLGFIGLPVFAGFSGGASTLVSPAAGYLISLPLMAYTISVLKQKPIISLLLGTVVCYMFGTIWFMFVTKMELIPSLMMCVIPFLIGDLFKIIISLAIFKKMPKNVA